MSRPDWISASPEALEASSSVIPFGLASACVELEMSLDTFQMKGLSFLQSIKCTLQLITALLPTQNKLRFAAYLIICDEMFADLTKFDRNYCTDLDGIKEKIMQCLV